MTVLNERLMEVILTEENLQAAYRQVKANGGAPGMDGMGVKALAEHLDRHGERIKAKLLEGSYQPSPVRGVEIPKPQGGPLSPLLANLYLTPLDRELERRGLAFCRYADDITVFVGSARSAERVLNSLVAWIEEHLKLPVNREKSGWGRPWERQMLGFRLLEDGRIGIAPKSIARYKEAVRRLWEARQSLTSKELVQQWQRYVRGWWHYFRLADAPAALTRLDGWVRRHRRKCFWLRWHNRHGRHNALKRLGIRGRALRTASSRKGAWRIARAPTLQQALCNRILRRYGLWLPSDLAAA
jgi:hypothetical protein